MSIPQLPVQNIEVSTTMSSSDDCPLSAQEYARIANRFLQGTTFRIHPIEDKDNSLENSLNDRLLSHGLDSTKARKIARQGASVARHFYPLQPPDVQLITGVYAAYFFVLDDICAGEDEMRHFGRNLLHALPHSNGIFGGCAALLRQLNDYYLEFCTNKIVAGLIDHMSSTALEAETTGKFKQLHTSPGFPDYFRRMTGNPEAFVFLILHRGICSSHDEDTLNLFIQTVPELIDFTDKANDLLSFYKESILSTERNGYVYHRALADQKDISDVLDSLVTEIHDNIRNVKATLASHPVLSEAVQAYMAGYIGFHVAEPRYRLSELIM